MIQPEGVKVSLSLLMLAAKAKAQEQSAKNDVPILEEMLKLVHSLCALSDDDAIFLKASCVLLKRLNNPEKTNPAFTLNDNAKAKNLPLFPPSVLLFSFCIRLENERIRLVENANASMEALEKKRKLEELKPVKPHTIDLIKFIKILIAKKTDLMLITPFICELEFYCRALEVNLGVLDEAKLLANFKEQLVV